MTESAAKSHERYKTIEGKTLDQLLEMLTAAGYEPVSSLLEDQPLYDEQGNLFGYNDIMTYEARCDHITLGARVDQSPSLRQYPELMGRMLHQGWVNFIMEWELDV